MVRYVLLGPGSIAGNSEPDAAGSSRCVQGAYPAWLSAPNLCASGWPKSQLEWFDQSRLMLQKFETCPRWGANLSAY
jgi:hypothetical protein